MCVFVCVRVRELFFEEKQDVLIPTSFNILYELIYYCHIIIIHLLLRQQIFHFKSWEPFWYRIKTPNLYRRAINETVVRSATKWSLVHGWCMIRTRGKPHHFQGFSQPFSIKRLSFVKHYHKIFILLNRNRMTRYCRNMRPLDYFSSLPY